MSDARDPRDASDLRDVGEVMIVQNLESRRGRLAARRLDRALAGKARGRTVERVALRELRERRPPAGRVIACGGDGTVNAVVAWLRRSGRRVPVSILPAGTGNNLAAGLGLPLDFDAALEAALSPAALFDVDAVAYRPVGEAALVGDDGQPADAERLFVQSAALGFPADVAGRFDRLRRRWWFRPLARVLGPATYAILALDGVARLRWRERRGEAPLEVRCELDGRVDVLPVLAIFFGNEESLGGGFHPCPRARVDDGRVDLCRIEAGIGMPYLSLLRRVSRGTHLDLPFGVRYDQTAGPVTLHLSRAMPLLADGDIWVRSNAWQLDVLSACFSLCVPQPRQSSAGGSGAESPEKEPEESR